MNRSTALLTVLLAFAIFAIPTSAAPPAQYVMQVEVVNQEEPVKICDVCVEKCRREYFICQINESLHDGSNAFQIWKPNDFQNKNVVFTLISVAAHISELKVLTSGTFEIGECPEHTKLFFAYNMIESRHDPETTRFVNWSFTTLQHVYWPYTTVKECSLWYKVELQGANFGPDLIQITVSGYYTDPACPNP